MLLKSQLGEMLGPVGKGGLVIPHQGIAPGWAEEEEIQEVPDQYKIIVDEMRQSLVTIYDIELLECRLPELTIRVRCSKGTYIRSLAREIGEALSSGAYLTSLRRTRSGTHDVEAAWQLDDFLKKLRGE